MAVPRQSAVVGKALPVRLLFCFYIRPFVRIVQVRTTIYTGMTCAYLRSNIRHEDTRQFGSYPTLVFHRKIKVFSRTCPPRMLDYIGGMLSLVRQIPAPKSQLLTLDRTGLCCSQQGRQPPISPMPVE